jgi:hypothetical protein
MIVSSFIILANVIIIVNYDRITFYSTDHRSFCVNKSFIIQCFCFVAQGSQGRSSHSSCFMANSVNVNKPLRLPRDHHKLTHLQSRCRRWVMKIEFFLIHYVFCLNLSKGINIYNNEYASIIDIYFYEYFL